MDIKSQHSIIVLRLQLASKIKVQMYMLTQHKYAASFKKYEVCLKTDVKNLGPLASCVIDLSHCSTMPNNICQTIALLIFAILHLPAL